MISCTEFIAAYSELFSYIDEKYGRKEVDHFWKYLFEPDGKGIPLINHVQKEGIRGCFTYWALSLNEEAADFTMYLNEKRGFFMIDMHRCPSKGRLLELKEEIGITPYYDYCLHCDSYRSAVEKIGLKYIYNFKGMDKASCSILIYDPSVFDGRVIIDNDTEVMDRKAAENEYFHKDFHSSMNMGIHYLGTQYEMEAVEEYLVRFTRNVYRSVIDDVKRKGFSALEDKIKDTYIKEKQPHVLEMAISPDHQTMLVKVKYCPGVQHLKNTGREVSRWYRYTTEAVMKTLANDAGYRFVMDSYDEDTGATEYRFIKDKTDVKKEVKEDDHRQY